MWAKYSLYTLPLKNGRLRKPEELPKERSLLDCMIHKATSEATAGRSVYLLAMDISEAPLVRRITMLNPDLSSFLKSVKGKLVACTPPVQPRQFSPVAWFRAVPEEGAVVVLYGADMIFNSYAAAVKALKEAQEIKNCEIIFAWRDEDMPAIRPPGRDEPREIPKGIHAANCGGKTHSGPHSFQGRQGRLLQQSKVDARSAPALLSGEGTRLQAGPGGSVGPPPP